MTDGAREDFDTVTRCIVALDRLTSLLQAYGQRDGRWTSFAAEKQWGELVALRGRLGDVDRDEWHQGFAGPILSPLDVHEIRDALDYVARLNVPAAIALTAVERDALLQLASLLERYISSDP